MNILHVTPTFWPATYWGGPIVSTYGLCNGLASIPGVILRVLTSDAAGPRLSQRVKVEGFPTRVPKGYEVYYTHRILGQNVAPGLWARLWSMVKWADVVHITGVYSSPTIPALFACRMLGKPVVWSPRGALQRWKDCRKRPAKALWEIVCRILAPSKLVLHATSEPEAIASRKRIPNVAAIVIPNGVIIPTRVIGARSDTTLRLIYLGRLHPIKGLENLLEGCKFLNDDNCASWSLTIAGSGNQPYEASLKTKITEMGLAEQVKMIGEVVEGEKEALFGRADVLVLPSYAENFGMVVAEALAHGVPVIASTATPWERVVEKNCGLWVDNSPESLSRAIRAIREMPVREMGEQGRDWVTQEFSWSTQSHRMMELYQRLISYREASGRSRGKCTVRDTAAHAK